MASDLSNWPRTPSPLRTRERVLRAVHAFRAAVKSAKVEWKGIKHDDEGDTLTGSVTFRIEIEEDTLDGGYVAKCVELPGCYSQGESEDEAAANIVEAIAGVMEARMARHLRERTPLHGPDDEPSHPHRHTLEIPVT